MEALTSKSVCESEMKEWIDKHGGDVLILDGTGDIDRLTQQAISYIRDESKNRDRSSELELLRKAIKE